jgi:hypothetical protein
MAQVQDIKEHMEVLGSDGQHVGTVDCTKGENKIVLTKSDPDAAGEHHVIPLAWVARVDERVHLNKASAEAQAQWMTATAFTPH